MPCYSRIETILIDLKTIEAAAQTLGIQVIRRTNNSFTLKRGNEHIGIERLREGEKFYASPLSGTSNYTEQILKPLTQAYAKERVKAYYKGKGYTVAAGSKPNSLVFTKYS